MKNITVLGCGMVGSAIAADLSALFKVTSVDLDEDRLNKLKAKYPVEVKKADVSSPDEIKEAVKEADIVVSAVPGFLGFNTLKAVIEAGKDVVDISFFGEDAFTLDALAKEKNVTAVVDCGVAPGMSNIILGYYNKKYKVNSFTCFVGGLPFKRTFPFQYKAPFSPIDVIEEYTRDARLVENGAVITQPALSEIELVSFETVGTLEAFNTDGLRTLLKMKIPNMKEKTLRYPGHVEYVKVLKDTGFFNSEKIDVNGIKVSPLDISTRLLFPVWKLEESEPEFTVMKIFIRIDKREYSYELFDKYDEKTGFSSMARTTGFTCAAAVNLLANNMYSAKGITPPEYLSEDEKNFIYILNYLKERKVDYQLTINEL